MAGAELRSGFAGLSQPISSLRPEPGLRNRTLRAERYRVPGGGAIAVGVEPGDRVTVTDSEGGQPGELLAFDSAGRPSLGALGARETGAATGLLALLASEEDSAQMLARRLARSGIDLGRARAQKLFAPDGAAGESASFTSQGSLIVVVAAPGEWMDPTAQNAPTDLFVEIERAQARPPSFMPLPEPLADPRLELRVAAGTAGAYEVKAGEWIQIIDVAGRECSDFMAFDARKLAKGIERFPDTTTTRSLIGLAYAGPGLASKFFDQDQQPLIEIVQDTVGRHDAFGLACTAKYYDDVGYPGHVNCSENLNAALAPYGVEPKAGWPALNWFYNTRIDARNVFYLDEPWSRPGDYVLLRAPVDLVCGSTACPDEISPANGWDPTDIHVRIYSPEKTFRKAVAYRMTAEAEPQLTRETGFHPRTSALTRNFVEYRGFWLPNHYDNNGPVEEYWACRERAIVMDLSALRKFEITGPDAETLLQAALTRNVRKLAVGQVVYSAMCYESGGMIDDGTLFRLGQDNFRWIGGDDYGGIWLRQLAAKLGLKAWVRSSTDQMHNISVQGPKSREILKQIVWTPPAQTKLEELEWFRLSFGRIGDHNGIPIVVSRTGYTGELGYELWCHPKHATQLWDSVVEAGKPHGIAPLGLAGLDILRIEAGLIFAGYEFNDQTDPFEAGIGFSVALKGKEDDFVGKAALVRRKEHPRHQLVGLELDGNEVAVHGDCVHVGRSQIGVVTSGTRSPILRKSIALCRIDAAYAAPGTEVEVGKIDGHQKRIPAKVVKFPFYDPEKLKPRGLA